MYKLKHLDTKELSKLNIRHQDKIIKRTGSKFIPLKAYEILKEETEDFSIENDSAKLVDALFVDLLQREGITLSIPEEKPQKEKTQKSKPKDQRVKQLAFLQQLDLELLELELELEMEMNKQTDKAA